MPAVVRARAAQAHPRVCGENGPGLQRHLARRRLIPACAGKTSSAARASHRCEAHPRVCGENLVLGAHRPPRRGSSPRVRGKPRRPHRQGRRRRLIPACAGKTGAGAQYPSCCAAHPRVCGENDQSITIPGRAIGSSPRVRGKLEEQKGKFGGKGLIPACAGKTWTGNPSWPSSSAHPRVCGENTRHEAFIYPHLGSSPRVRGKRDHHRAQRRPPRLIPACAGKTRGLLTASDACPAHPRVCGENAAGIFAASGGGGSSPRVRGKQGGLDAGGRARGLIPACAGKTSNAAPNAHPTTAHPRVCGENKSIPPLGRSMAGSSPRVRGKRQAHAPGAAAGRLIPACAGKTSTPAWPGTRPPAHPRVCGENSPRVWRRTIQTGSSPRVRGKLPCCPLPSRLARLIPACAGKTRPAPTPGRDGEAHPRVCGENITAALDIISGVGSSPRVRGKQGGVVDSASAGGLIPACAGKTSPSPARTRPPPAHPRVCGENRLPRLPRALTMGSSPRVRGKRPQEDQRSGL